jgi:NADH-quinone oxidoreductase subunit J
MYIINIIKNPNIFFLIITVLIVICALLVILSKNPIHSILFLVLIFVLTTILFLTLNVDFLAMLFLVLYVGAIVVLFLFVVMMLNVRILELKERVISYLPIAIIIVSVFFILIIFVLKLNFLTESSTLQEDTLSGILKSVFDVFHHDMHVLFKEIWSNSFLVLESYNNISLLGAALYTDYVYLFLLAGIVLLVAMLGAIVLTHHQLSKSKRQDYYLQTNKDITKAIRHLK